MAADMCEAELCQLFCSKHNDIHAVWAAGKLRQEGSHLLLRAGDNGRLWR